MRAVSRLLLILSCLSLVELSCSSHGESGAPPRQWAQTIQEVSATSGIPIFNEIRSAQPTPDGGYVVVGSTTVAGNWDVWVLKLDANGSILWQKTFGGALQDQANAVQVTADGGYIVAGYTESFGAGSRDAWVLRLDADGGVVWQKSYGGTLKDEAYSVRATADGGCVVAGYLGVSSSAQVGGAWVFKLDSSGGMVWQKSFDGGQDDYASSVQGTPDGGYVVAGRTFSSGAGSGDAWVVRLDAIGGVLWQKTYGGRLSDYASSVQPTSDGGYVLAGGTSSSGAGGYDAWVVKLDANGNILWQKTYGGAQDDNAFSVQAIAGGGYVVAGYWSRLCTNSCVSLASLMNLDESGDVVWQRTYGRDYFRSVQVTADGGYVVAGHVSYLASLGLGRGWVLKLDSNGSIRDCAAIERSNASAADSSAFSVDRTAANGNAAITPVGTTAAAGSSAAAQQPQCPAQ